MFCSKCGAYITDGSQFCAQCGTPVQPAPPMQGYVPYQTPPVQNSAPVSVQQPDSPLRPALRHPFFYVCAVVCLIFSCFTVCKDLRDLSFSFSSYQLQGMYWIFVGILPALLSLSITILIMIGLILLFTAGLRKDGTVPESGFTLMRVALVISLVAAIYSVISTLLSGIRTINLGGNALTRYAVINLATSLLISIPLGVILRIFAIKANQTALAMAKGKNTTISGALPVMLFVHAGIALLLCILESVGMELGSYLSSRLFSTLLPLLPNIFFGILLLIMPQKQQV